MKITHCYLIFRTLILFILYYYSAWAILDRTRTKRKTIANQILINHSIDKVAHNLLFNITEVMQMWHLIPLRNNASQSKQNNQILCILHMLTTKLSAWIGVQVEAGWRMCVEDKLRYASSAIQADWKQIRKNR